MASKTIGKPNLDIIGSALISEAKEEQNALRDELKGVLDEMAYGALAEGDAQMMNNLQEVVGKIPMGIYVG